VAVFYNEKPGARIALAEDQFTLGVVARDCPFGQKLQFGFRKVGKNRNSAERINGARLGRHFTSIVNLVRVESSLATTEALQLPR
jgi:hypothetical protein